MPKKRQAQPTPARSATAARTPVPSPQTLYRLHLLDRETHAVLRKATAKLQPFLWARDRGIVEQIRQAETPEALLDLAPLATGLGDAAWEEQMRRFGPQVVPLIAARLKNARAIRDATTRDKIFEKLIAELRWRDDAGAATLMECFDALDDYGRSLAALVLGLLGAQQAADQLWGFYQQVAYHRRESYLVGALWGLIDLQDARVGEALVDLLEQRHMFHELFGFLSLAGDARAVIPLVKVIVQASNEDERYEPRMALLSIGHRIGRDALAAELLKVTPPARAPAGAEELADTILATPASFAEECFAIFHHRITPEDMERAFEA